MESARSPSARPGEQSIALTRDFRLLQKRRGHRYSVDDMLVGHLAGTRGGAPRRVLDLGCGLGSVLLITAWAFPEAELVGLELNPELAEFARRNVLLNRCAPRVRIAAGDLRDRALLASLGRFELVTGSPPYFAPGSGTPCADPARAAAHFELHGGIEEYALAASQVLAPGGVFAACAGAAPPGRDRGALLRAGLTLVQHRYVLPREGKAPFLSLLVGAQAPAPAAEAADAAPLVLRRADGRRTPEHLAIRAWTGIPPRGEG
ncbi:MAG TPA: methyltransferase domain-containing protein [Myxococcota bacterium]|nr:methyltransferase domain-containing protein [Myxococcota bacterium]HRY94539.1 methyltransferase domain-containing protein [Myxococcota bacterium]HSA24220.1 methyltransferase domain-containing protein [Myxococcota bacterium]